MLNIQLGVCRRQRVSHENEVLWMKHGKALISVFSPFGFFARPEYAEKKMRVPSTLVLQILCKIVPFKPWFLVEAHSLLPLVRSSLLLVSSRAHLTHLTSKALHFDLVHKSFVSMHH